MIERFLRQACCHGHEFEMEAFFLVARGSRGRADSGRTQWERVRRKELSVYRLGVLLHERIQRRTCRAQRGRSCRPVGKRGVEISTKTRFFSRRGLGLGNPGMADAMSMCFSRATAGKGANSRCEVRYLWQGAIKSQKHDLMPN